LAGVNIDLRNITSEQAMGIAAYEEALNLAAGTATSNKNLKGTLGVANDATKKLTESIKAGEKAVKNASKSEAGYSKARIKEIQDQIKAIREKADAKKKALSDTVDAENTELELKKLQLEAQSALARGDRDAYEAANLSIEQLTKQTQLKKASDKIDANAKKEIDAKQKLLDDDQAKKDKQQDTINNYTKNGQTAAETLNQINSVKSALAQLAIDQIENNALKDPGKKAEGQNSLDGRLQTIIGGLEKSSDVIQKAFPDFVDSKTNKGKFSTGMTEVPGVGSFATAPGQANQAFAKLVSEVQGGAKANFIAMADSIKGGATLAMVVKAMGGTIGGTTKVTQTEVSAAIKTIPARAVGKGVIDLASKYAKDQTQDNGSLEDDVRKAVVKSLGLKEGQSFEFGGITYNVKKDGSAVRRALGGYAASGQKYIVNDRINSLGVQQEGFMPFTPKVSGIVYPNADTMPKYNFGASNDVNGMRGAINSSYNNNSYTISIALNGTNVTADDVMRRFKAEMAMVHAKEGRPISVGGGI
jgi:hypothetical protein